MVPFLLRFVLLILIRRKKQALRPVTMEGEKFELPEDPSQTLPGWSPMGRIWYIIYVF